MKEEVTFLKFPCTIGQESILASSFDNINYNSASNLSYSWKINGELNVNSLEKSINKIVERHEAFRTKLFYDSSERKFFQIVQEYNYFTIQKKDLSPLSNKSNAIREIDYNINQRAMDLTKEVFRVHLAKVEIDTYILNLCIHHVVCDGWSLGVLREELENGYNAFISRENYEPPQVEIQSGDYAVWHNQLLELPNVQNRAMEIGKTVDDFLEVSPFVNIPNREFIGTKKIIEIKSETLKMLKKHSADNNITLFMLLLYTAYKSFRKVINKKKILFNTPVANRENIALEKTIGLIRNTVMLPIEEKEKELSLNDIKKICLASFRDSDVPYELVKKYTSYNNRALFDIGFALQNAHSPMSELKLDNLKVHELNNNEVIVNNKFNIVFNFTEYDDSIYCEIIYRENIIKPNTIEKVASEFHKLLVGYK